MRRMLVTKNIELHLSHATRCKKRLYMDVGSDCVTIAIISSKEIKRLPR